MEMGRHSALAWNNGQSAARRPQVCWRGLLCSAQELEDGSGGHERVLTTARSFAASVRPPLPATRSRRCCPLTPQIQGYLEIESTWMQQIPFQYVLFCFVNHNLQQLLLSTRTEALRAMLSDAGQQLHRDLLRSWKVFKPKHSEALKSIPSLKCWAAVRQKYWNYLRQRIDWF